MIKALLTRHEALIKQFLQFALVGLSGTGVQYVSLWIGADILGTSATTASAIGYILGCFVNYYLNYLFTFKSAKSHADAASKYFTVVGVGWCINTGLMALFTGWLGFPKWPSQIVTTGIGLIWNFGGSKLWAFKHREPH
ncbi:GtrA family protein [Burkholderiaceae bacterium DAT-1]|nr:GtrA family protein [Burkholderiaceae bacterium DAT-1]